MTRTWLCHSPLRGIKCSSIISITFLLIPFPDYAMFAKVYIFVAFLSLIVTVNAANVDLEKRQGGESYDPYQFACIK